MDRDGHGIPDPSARTGFIGMCKLGRAVLTKYSPI
jgi:hypothetical protein